jgi:methylmalonyl-CoA mutase
MDDHLTLAAEFPQATREQWRKLVEAVLAGRPFDRTLVSSTYDGLAIEPLYMRRSDAQPVFGRGLGRPWRIIQRVDNPDPSAASAEALHDLENGATGLSLVFAGSIGGYGYGLDASEAAIARVLEGIELGAGITLDLDLAPQTGNVAELLAAWLERGGTAPSATDIRFGLDPIGAAAVSGASPRSSDALLADFTRVIAQLAGRGFRGPLAVADGRPIHNAAGSSAQELAYVLAVALAYLRALEGEVGLDAARALIAFRLGADADQFLTLAKFRAFRKLWARIEAGCGLAPKPAFLAAETAWRMMAKREPHLNMLRATLAVFSAALGGADAITVLPFTMALGLPDRFARRIARNTQLILIEESSLARVLDPAAGAGAIEDLTDQLCRTAWTFFQGVEKAGGAIAALEQGVIQRAVAAVREQRSKAVAHREDALTGTSDFPDIEEREVAVLDVAPIAPAATAAAWNIEPLPRVRLAEPFERLRERSDARLAESGIRPRVFLANLGTTSAYAARASFAKNFFEAGGIEAASNEGFASPDKMVEAFMASGASLACLCSSDEVYARQAAAAARDLRGAGAAVWLAGRPGCLESALRDAGVNRFVFAGCDALSALEEAHAVIESPAP